MSFLVRVASWLGFRASGAPRLGEAGRVIHDLPLWEQSGRIGGGLTPRDVTTILHEADAGDMARLMDLANESRQKDCHLHSVLSTNEESIAGLPWQLVPPEDALKKEKVAAKWLEEMLRNTPSFPLLLGHLAGGVYYGRSVGEKVFRKDSGRLIIDRFENLAPRRFGFRMRDGRLVWRDQGMAVEGIDFRELYPHKFVVSQPRVTGDVPQREGLCRVLIWAALFRNWTFTDWLRTGEIAWKPWRIGTYKKNAPPEDKTGLETVLRQLTTQGAGMLPDTTSIKIEWPGGGGSGARSTHAELANVIAQEMSKATLGQTETVQASTSSGYAQAKVMNEVRKDLRESRARQVASDVMRDVVIDLINLNFDGIRPPRFEFITQDPIDLKAFAEAIGTLVDKAGMTSIPAKWVHEAAGIPEPKDNELVLGTPEIPITEGEPEDGEEPDPEPDSTDDEEKPEDKTSKAAA